jgi:hypothetical protein
MNSTTGEEHYQLWCRAHPKGSIYGTTTSSFSAKTANVNVGEADQY